MFEYNNIPNSKVKTYFFNKVGTYMWNKPQGCSMIHFTTLGGGGGGGGQGTFASNIRGGAGGSSSTLNHALVPAPFLPDILQITVGAGGAGAGAGGGGTAGGASSVASWINNLGSLGQAQIILQSSGGQGGSATGIGASVGSRIGTINYARMINVFDYNVINGVLETIIYTNGGRGGDANGNTAGQDIVFGGNNCTNITGGAGGGSNGNTANPQLGGNITNIPSLYGNTSITAGDTAGANGQNGYTLWKPTFISFGGSGGNANTGGRGGKGGDGGYGAGGGGSGAGTNTLFLTGGKGGDGFVIISCW